MKWSWSRRADNGYECSSRGDQRFSALFARLKDGRTIEEAWQLDVKGYREKGDDWRLGKGKPPLGGQNRDVQWTLFLELWEQWAEENPDAIEDLRQKASGKVLTDMFANSPINQARALSTVLNNTEKHSLFE